MKIIISIILALTFKCLSVQGQINNSKIIGSWIMINRVYNSGEILPVKLAMAQTYFRFEFKVNGKAFKAFSPLDNGFIFDFTLSGNNLKIGFINYQLNYLSSDTLILTEEGPNGFDSTAIKYYFIPERIFQQKIPVTHDMIIFSGKDSIYIENEKFRASFNKDQTFSNFLGSQITYNLNAISKEYLFMATFIINSDGSIDSIKIHKSVAGKFDNQFINAVIKSSEYWVPAKNKDKNVSVIRTIVDWNFKSLKTKELYLNYENGIISMLLGDYKSAIDSFNLCNESE